MMVFQKGNQFGKYKRTEEINKKSSEVRKRLFKEGKIKPNRYWKGKKRDELTKNKISLSTTKLKNNICIICKKEFHPHYQNQKCCSLKCRDIILSNQRKGNWNKKYKEESKKKMRLSRINYIQKCYNNNLPIHPTIGKNENIILNRVEQELNYKIIRQYFIDGYWVDGYIPELKLVIEVDEKAHEKKKQRDIQRENYIKQKLNCRFIRIKDYK